jgi:ABC-type branched-subunit amino acid transport system substrate-binding protein
LGRFTGQTYVVQQMRPEELLGKDQSPSLVGVLAVTDVETLRKLGATFAPAQVAVFNLSLDDEALRQACLPNVLHTPPSAQMKADAVAQWQKRHPGAQVEAWAWHPDFEKYAGRDLNKRFREAFNVPMDNDAWAGWAAMRIVAEATARTQTTEPARILAYLRHEMEFDGQKGMPHTFRDTGQLRQPLLIVQDGKIVGEAPVRGAADPSNLDSLGMVSCHH